MQSQHTESKATQDSPEQQKMLFDRYYKIGQENMEKGHYSKALHEFSCALSVYPKVPESVYAHCFRGILYMEFQHKLDLAIQDFINAIELKPDYSHGHWLLGIAYGKQKQYDFALASLDKAIQLDQNNASAYVCRGDTLQTQQKFKQAIESFTTAIKLDPNNDIARKGCGLVFRKAFTHLSAEMALLVLDSKYWEYFYPEFMKIEGVKQTTLAVMNELKEQTKEAKCQTLTQKTFYGKLFHIQQGVYKPSIERGTLNKIALELQTELTVEDAKKLSPATKTALQQDFNLQEALQQNTFVTLYNTFVQADVFKASPEYKQQNTASKIMRGRKNNPVFVQDKPLDQDPGPAIQLQELRA